MCNVREASSVLCPAFSHCEAWQVCVQWSSLGTPELWFKLAQVDSDLYHHHYAVFGVRQLRVLCLLLWSAVLTWHVCAALADCESQKRWPRLVREQKVTRWRCLVTHFRTESVPQVSQ